MMMMMMMLSYILSCNWNGNWQLSA